jgi:hypothetical protein
MVAADFGYLCDRQEWQDSLRAYTDADYRDRADPEEAVRSLKEATVAA